GMVTARTSLLGGLPPIPSGGVGPVPFRIPQRTRLWVVFRRRAFCLSRQGHRVRSTRGPAARCGRQPRPLEGLPMPALPGIPKRFWAGGLIGVALTLCGGPSLPAGGPGKADDETIAGLIRQLGDPQFKARERAAAELLKLGKAALAQLQQAARAGTDPEIRRR